MFSHVDMGFVSGGAAGTTAILDAAEKSYTNTTSGSAWAQSYLLTLIPANSTLILVVATDSAVSLSSANDDFGNTFSVIASHTATARKVWILRANNSTLHSSTLGKHFNVNFSAAAVNKAAYLFVLQGLDLTTPEDKTATANANSSSAVSVGPTAALSKNDEVVIIGTIWDETTATSPATTHLSPTTVGAGSRGDFYPGGTSFKLNVGIEVTYPSSSAVSFAGTIVNGSGTPTARNWASALATFKIP